MSRLYFLPMYKKPKYPGYECCHLALVTSCEARVLTGRKAVVSSPSICPIARQSSAVNHWLYQKKMNIWIFICMIRTNYNDHSISGQTLMFILMLWSGPCPVWYHLRAGVYCLYCSPPTGGDQAVLTSLSGSLHAVHLWYGAQFSH